MSIFKRNSLLVFGLLPPCPLPLCRHRPSTTVTIRAKPRRSKPPRKPVIHRCRKAA